MTLFPATSRDGRIVPGKNVDSSVPVTFVGSKRAVGDRAGGHVVAEGFRAVDIDHGSSAAHQAQIERGDLRRVGDVDGLSEIGGDESVACRSRGNNGGFVAVAVAKLGRAGRPGSVAEGGRSPCRAGAGSGCEIFPSRAGSDQRQGAAAERSRVGDVGVARVASAAGGARTR